MRLFLSALFAVTMTSSYLYAEVIECRQLNHGGYSLRYEINANLVKIPGKAIYSTLKNGRTLSKALVDYQLSREGNLQNYRFGGTVSGAGAVLNFYGTERVGGGDISKGLGFDIPVECRRAPTVEELGNY